MDFNDLKKIFENRNFPEKSKNPEKNDELEKISENVKKKHISEKFREFEKKMNILEYNLENQIKYSFNNIFDHVYLLNDSFHFDNDKLNKILLSKSSLYQKDEELYDILYKEYLEAIGEKHYGYSVFRQLIIFKNILKNAKKLDHGKILIIFDENINVTTMASLEKQFNYSMQNDIEWQMIFFTHVDKKKHKKHDMYNKHNKPNKPNTLVFDSWEYNYMSINETQSPHFTNSFIQQKIDLNHQIYAMAIDCEILNSIYEKINVISKQTLFNPLLCLGLYYKHKYINLFLLEE